MNQKKNGPPAADIESGATTDDDHLFDDLAKALMTPSAAERDLAVIPPVTEVQLEVVKAADPFASAITAFVAIHREVVYQEAEKLRAMIQAGEILAGIKAQGKADGSIPHGQWMDWCRENIEKSNDVSHQWVTRYMRAFSLKDDPRVTTDPEAV